MLIPLRRGAFRPAVYEDEPSGAIGDVRELVAIKRAIKVNDVATVQRLLTGDPGLVIARGEGWTPLQDAAFQARTAIVNLMLAEGAGITPVDIAHALHHAVQLPRIDPDVIEALLATGHVCEPFVALYRGDVAELARSLLAAPALIHAKDAEGCAANIESGGECPRGDGPASLGAWC